ncbi:MAG: SAM-dependent methyltransferase [Cyanobacteria bacterium SBLK]|nr:SAM-dependent methyltransferase [Cyanobacteria bacterium SBLK]
MQQKSKLLPQAFIPFSARLMAALRAKESARSDRLFDDPFAARLAGKEAMEFANTQSQPRDIAYLAMRTKLFDDFFQDVLFAKKIPEISQVVLLAAGMDSRAYRLYWPENTYLYELDFSGILAYKKNRLNGILPRCKRIEIAADLTQPWTHHLLEQGYQRDRPSLWLLEGLLMYLEASQCDRLLREIASLTVPGSYLGLDLIDRQTLQRDRDSNGYFQFGIDDPIGFLAQYNWTATIANPADLKIGSDRFNRFFAGDRISDTARPFLVTAWK